MRLPVRSLLSVLVLTSLLAALVGPAGADPGRRGPRHRDVRVATFNASLFRATEGELIADLSTLDDMQAQNVAEIVQIRRPDVLLVNELDYDRRGRAARLLSRNYFERGQGGQRAIHYPHRMAFASNTGIASGFDLNNDGQIGESGRAYGDDAFGFGEFPGQYGFAVYSMYPIVRRQVRSFQHFLWKDMPGALLPDDPATPRPADWYSRAELRVFRLSSKNHVDVPLRVGRETVHLLASHPTPPAFDGPERRNQLRNHDEIRLWADYVRGGRRARYITDDDGHRGGLRRGSSFIVAGDLNADPNDGGGVPGAADQLLEHPRIQDPLPASDGAVEQARLQGGANDSHRSDPAYDTADFAEPPGNLRVDYVLPSRRLRVTGAEVFWPRSDDKLFELVGTFDPSLPGGFPASDHRMVHVDLRVHAGRR